MSVPFKHGLLQAEIEQVNGRSIISSLRQRMPLRASSPLYLTDNGAVFFYIMNPAAGLLQGDQHSILLHVKQDSKAVVFGQGATKVFRSPEGILSKQFITLRVDDGARLEYMPETVIPFAEACLLSRTNLHISNKASGIFWEITAPGRVARKELFAYHLLDQQTNIFLDRELIFSDRFKLEPATVPEFLKTWHKPLGILHGYTHMGTFWVIDPKLETVMLELVQRNTDHKNGFLDNLAEQFNILIAGTAIRQQAYCFRAMGYSAETIQDGFKELWKILRLRLYQETEWPWRKF